MNILNRPNLNTEQAKSLVFSIALTGFVLLVEVIGGFLTNSLALLSDAAHVLADLVSLGLALFALILATFPASDTRTYGWHRSEVFAALINGLSLLVISGVILFEAYHRIIEPEPVKSLGMLGVATFGLVINLLVVHRLHGHGAHDLNIRSAFLHVLGDALISVGVILGGITMYFTGWYIVDPILSVIFSLVILRGAGKVIYEALHILFEGVPRGLDIKRVVEEMKKVEHVIDVHRVHLWSICSNITAMSAHVTIEPDFQGQRRKIVNELNCLLMSCYKINHTTLQLEKGKCDYVDLVCDINHCDIPSARHDHDHDHDHDHVHEHSH